MYPYFRPGAPLPQESLLLIGGAPFASCFAALGLVLFTGAVPSLLLLCPTQDSPALALLKAYRAGLLLTCIVCILAPFLYAALDILLFRRWGRRLERTTVLYSIPSFTVISLVFLFLIVVVAWGGALWRAELPRLYSQYGPEIQQIESGELEQMTVLLDGGSFPDSMPGASSDDLTFHCRGAVGPDSDWEWITLRIPDGLHFEPVPESFPVIGETWGWNWERVQRYQVSYTTNFHLVTELTPVP